MVLSTLGNLGNLAIVKLLYVFRAYAVNQEPTVFFRMARDPDKRGLIYCKKNALLGSAAILRKVLDL